MFIKYKYFETLFVFLLTNPKKKAIKVIIHIIIWIKLGPIPYKIASGKLNEELELKINLLSYAYSINIAIIKDNAKVKATPEITADNVEANLIHEAAIGKIAGEQLIKLMTLGLSEKEAEEQIINGFLR